MIGLDRLGGRLLVGALCALAGTAALAAPGDHIRTKSGAVITPEVGAGVEGTSNVTLTAQDRQAAALFLGKLGLGVKLNTPKVIFDLGSLWLPRIAFAPRLKGLDDLGNVKFNLMLNVAPKGRVGFIFRDTLVSPTYADGREESDPLVATAPRENANTQIRNQMSFELPIRVGPEFVIEPGVGWTIHDYRVSVPGGQAPFNLRNTISPTLELSWQFFPNTAYVAEFRYDLNLYRSNLVDADFQAITTNDPNEQRALGDFLALPNSHHLHGTTGIRGRITEHLVLAVLAGYGFGLYQEATVDAEAPAEAAAELDRERDCPDGDLEAACYARDVSATDAILALVRVTVDLGHSRKATFGQRITAQYRKDFQDAMFTNYLHQHHFKLSLDSLWGRYVRSGIFGILSLEGFGGEYARRDLFTKVGGKIDILPTNYLVLELGVDWAQRGSTDDRVRYSDVRGRGVLSFVY